MQIARTRPAPAALRARAASETVDPVVKTSSTNVTFGGGGRQALNAPSWLRTRGPKANST